MRILGRLSPKRVFEIFEQLCAIPHGSGNEEEISIFCENFAKRNGLFCRRDSFNNVIIKKPASSDCKSNNSVILQGHLDMVCEKTDGSNFDFTKDGLKLKIENGYVAAEDTTLGGDDGIAVAMALAILEDNTITHPELIVIFTVDEERGMSGASNIDLSDINAKMLINIDSEEEGVLTVSCAGGLKCCISKDLMPCNVYGNVLEISVSGLLSGHSGVDIDKGRINADALIIELLRYLYSVIDFRLCNLSGGLKDNVIPGNCSTVICTGENLEKITDLCNSFISSFDLKNDTGAKITVKESNASVAFDNDSLECILSMFADIPNGVNAMSDDLPGLVKTSLNIGILNIYNNTLNAVISVRSSSTEDKEKLAALINKAASNAGGTCKVSGEYPAWEYNKNSVLRDIMMSVYARLFGSKPEVVVTHAGLECGILCTKIENLDAVSFGPNIKDIHTVKERLEIQSVERMYKFLIEVLKEL